MLGAAAACARLLKLDAAQDGDGARHRRVAADRRARAVRLDDQAVPSGGAARAGLTSALMARHGYTASTRALEAPRGLLQTYSTQVRLERDHRTSSASASRFRSTPTSRSPAASSSIRASTAASSCAMRISLRADDIERIDLLVHPLVLELTGKTRAEDRARGEVQRLSRLRRGDPVRPGGRSRILRCRRRVAPMSSRCAIASMPTVDAAIDEVSGRRDDPLQRRPHAAPRWSSTRSAACSGR